MRPGLVIVGTLLLVLGVASLAVVNLAPTGTHVTQSVSQIPRQDLLPNATNFALISGTNGSEATFSVEWSATVPTSVRLYEAPGCRSAALSCAQGLPARSWSSVEAGNWSVSGSLGFPYLVEWNSSGPAAGSWGLTAVELVTTPLAAPLLETLVLDAAGGALALVGAVALFLGLFLRGGVYAGPAPIVSRSADDAEAVSAGSKPPTR